MKYKDIKILDINPVVYLGEDFKDKDFKYNQNCFKRKIKNSVFAYGFGYECPIEDMISISVDYKDDFEPIIQEKTLVKILSVTNELLKIFGENVKINLYLDKSIEGIGNSLDMDIKEFFDYLREETKKFESESGANKFPILGSEPKEYIPLDIVKPHEKQALRNHGQTLKRLAERGGLSWIEALCVLEDRKYDYNISEIDAKVKVLKFIESV